MHLLKPSKKIAIQNSQPLSRYHWTAPSSMSGIFCCISRSDRYHGNNAGYANNYFLHTETDNMQNSLGIKSSNLKTRLLLHFFVFLLHQMMMTADQISFPLPQILSLSLSSLSLALSLSSLLISKSFFYRLYFFLSARTHAALMST